jgi:long-chain acyl-CoA synthetase
VAIVVPDMAALKQWATDNGITGDPLADAKTRALFEEELKKYGAEKGFERVEDFILVPEEFSVANDMLTPSLKVKRRVVVARHGPAIEALYQKKGGAGARAAG